MSVATQEKPSPRASGAAEGRTAIVSGGSRGLGAEIVRRLLEQGWRVATCSRNGPPDLLCDEMAESDRFLWRSADMSSTQSLRDFVKETTAQFGNAELLINNAAMLSEGLLTTTSEREIETLINVNLVAPIILTKACLKSMIRLGRGSIVNVSSINSIRGHQGVAAYTASKAGLDGFTRSMARELGPMNIRVNSVAPGFFDSELVAALTPTRRDRIMRRTPLNQLCDVEQVADAVMFLASDASAFITGQTLIVDGGYTC
jgi:3-oxoacyl-[acyl-carrier protein] reductase